MKRTILWMIGLLITVSLWSCNKDDHENEGPVVAFSELIYTLDAEKPLNVEIKTSSPVIEDTRVKFTIRGAAVKDEDYTLSAEEFVIPAGESMASITVFPKNNFSEGKTIKLELNPVSGYVFGEYNFTLIEIMTKGQLICSFQKADYLLPGEMIVRMDVKDASTGKFLSLASDTKIPFIVDELSTAVENVHFEFVDNPDKVFIIPAKKSFGTIKIRFLKLEEGKDNLSLLVSDDGQRYLPGNIDKTSITVFGPTTPKRLEGKWAFQAATSMDYLRENNWYGGPDEVEHLPENNLPSDMLEFVNDGKQLKVNIAGDLAKYFRDADVKFIKEREEYLQEQMIGGTNPEVVTISMFELSKVNVTFSDVTKKERVAQVGFRLLPDNKTLEVSVIDYEPTEFLYDTYKTNVDFTQEGEFPMAFHVVRYHFSRVE